MNNITFDTPEVWIHYDETLKIVLVKYGTQITPEVTIVTYQCLESLAKKLHGNEVAGSIYDFSAVTYFAPRNLTTIQKTSAKINAEDPRLKNHPVALIVVNQEQKQALLISLAVTQQNHRKKMVTSYQEAVRFIDDWHRQHHASVS